MKIIIYGNPNKEGETKFFIPEFYCAICKSIPLLEKWNREGKIEGYLIDELLPLALMEMTPQGLKEVFKMSCAPCINKIAGKMHQKLKRRFEGLGGEEGGGTPVSR